MKAEPTALVSIGCPFHRTAMPIVMLPPSIPWGRHRVASSSACGVILGRDEAPPLGRGETPPRSGRRPGTSLRLGLTGCHSMLGLSAATLGCGHLLAFAEPCRAKCKPKMVARARRNRERGGMPVRLRATRCGQKAWTLPGRGAAATRGEEPHMNVDIARRLCDLRHTHGLSQEGLAARLGVSRQAVSKWERGESSPDTDNLLALSELYGMTIDELLGRGDAGSGTAGFAGVACHADADADALGVGAGDADTPALDDTMGDAALSDLLETLRGPTSGTGRGYPGTRRQTSRWWMHTSSTCPRGRSAGSRSSRAPRTCTSGLSRAVSFASRNIARLTRSATGRGFSGRDRSCTWRRGRPAQVAADAVIQAPVLHRGAHGVCGDGRSLPRRADLSRWARRGSRWMACRWRRRAALSTRHSWRPAPSTSPRRAATCKAVDVRAGELSISTTSGSIKSFRP